MIFPETLPYTFSFVIDVFPSFKLKRMFPVCPVPAKSRNDTEWPRYCSVKGIIPYTSVYIMCATDLYVRGFALRRAGRCSFSTSSAILLWTVSNSFDVEEERNGESEERRKGRNYLHPYLSLVFSSHVVLFTILPWINKLISSVVLLDLDGRGLALYLCVVHLGRPGCCL